MCQKLRLIGEEVPITNDKECILPLQSTMSTKAICDKPKTKAGPIKRLKIDESKPYLDFVDDDGDD